MRYTDEESVGNWMMDFALDEKVRQRIACPEKGYPYSEALYANEKEWSDAHNGRDFYDFVAEIA